MSLAHRAKCWLSFDHCASFAARAHAIENNRPELPDSQPLGRPQNGSRPPQIFSLSQPEGLPEGYEMKRTDQGQLYFLHVPTGVSTWHDPRIPRDVTLAVILREDEQDSRTEAEILGQLPPGWERRETSTGRPYYVDTAQEKPSSRTRD